MQPHRQCHHQWQQWQQQSQQQQQLHTQHHEATAQHPHPLAALLSASLPPVDCAFAYGSAVFEQPDLPEAHEDAAAAALSQQSQPDAHPQQQQQHHHHHHWRAQQREIAAATAAGPMLDFVLVVDDAAAWHAANLARNADHYSLLARALGARGVAAAADGLGAGAWFNAFVPLGGRMVKYGVASRAALLADLAAWRHLYLAGRLHKPVLPLIGGDAPQLQNTPERSASSTSSTSTSTTTTTSSSSSKSTSNSSSTSSSTSTSTSSTDEALRAALAANRASALRAALLLSPPAAPLPDVLRRVAGLSYAGDVRMGLAEDGRKVERIAAGSWAGLVAAYLPLLRAGNSGGDDPPLVPGLKLEGDDFGSGGSGSGVGGSGVGGPLASYFTSRGVVVRRDTSADAAAEALAALPAGLLARMARRVGVRNDWAAAAAAASTGQPPVDNSGGGNAAIGDGAASEAAVAADVWRRDVAWAAARSGRAEAVLHAALAATVRASSARQAALGVLSAGPVHAARYVGAKLAKAWGARR